MAYLSMALPSKKLKLPRKFNTLESLVIESKLGRHDVVLIGIYRPPKANGKDYVRVEKDLHNLISWASLRKQFVIIMGNLNLDRLKPYLKEGKILHDTKEIYGLTCMITKATRVTRGQPDIT